MAVTWNKTTRDAVLFVGGLIGVGYETIFEQVDRPALLVLFGGMMGLPVFLHRDEKGNGDDVPKPTPKDA